MPGTGRWRLSALMSAGVVALVMVGCGGGEKSGGTSAAANQAPAAVDQQARDDIKKINDYLGTVPDNSETEKTLLKTLNKNNTELRNILHDMQCDIYFLKHPGETTCKLGGPSTSPTNVPKYPQ